MILIVTKYLVPKRFLGFTAFLRKESDIIDLVLLNHKRIRFSKKFIQIKTTLTI
jgi:hypothetical protein